MNEVESLWQHRGVGGGGSLEIVIVHGHRDDRRMMIAQDPDQIREIARRVADRGYSLIDLIDDDVGPRDVHRRQLFEHRPRRAPSAHGEDEASTAFYRTPSSLGNV